MKTNLETGGFYVVVKGKLKGKVGRLLHSEFGFDSFYITGMELFSPDYLVLKPATKSQIADWFLEKEQE